MESENKIVASLLLGGVFGAMFMVATFFHANESKAKLVSYSDDTWTAVEVESKAMRAGEGNSLTYSLGIDSKGQIDLSYVVVDEYLYNSVEVDDVIRLRIEDSEVKEIDKYDW